jgi:hypothetical protein
MLFGLCAGDMAINTTTDSSVTEANSFLLIIICLRLV